MDGDTSATAQLDIGAVEAGPVFLVESGTEGGVSLRHAMTLAAADPAPGVRIAFRADPTIFPATTIALIGGFGELALPAGKSFFLDASNLSSPVKISANASRVFNIPATSTLALHSLKIITGRAPNGPNGFSDPVSTNGTDGGSGSDRGAIFSTGLLTVTACTFADNTTGNSGQFGSSFTVGVSGNGGAIAHRGGVPCRLTALPPASSLIIALVLTFSHNLAKFMANPQASLPSTPCFETASSVKTMAVETNFSPLMWKQTTSPASVETSSALRPQ